MENQGKKKTSIVLIIILAMCLLIPNGIVFYGKIWVNMPVIEGVYNGKAIKKVEIYSDPYEDLNGFKVFLQHPISVSSVLNKEDISEDIFVIFINGKQKGASQLLKVINNPSKEFCFRNLKIAIHNKLGRSCVSPGIAFSAAIVVGKVRIEEIKKRS